MAKQTVTITGDDLIVEQNFGGGPQMQQLVIRELANMRQIDASDPLNYPMSHEFLGVVVALKDAAALRSHANSVFALAPPAKSFGFKLRGEFLWREVEGIVVPILPLEMIVVSARAAKAIVLDVIEFRDKSGKQVDLPPADVSSKFVVIAQSRPPATITIHPMIGYAGLVWWAASEYPTDNPRDTGWTIGTIFGRWPNKVLSRQVPSLDAIDTPDFVTITPVK